MLNHNKPHLFMKKILLLCVFSILALTACTENEKQADPIFTLISQNDLFIDEAGGFLEIEFTTNSPWDAEVLEGSEWCSLDSYMGEGGENIVISANATKNPDSGDRVATILLTSDINSEEITLTQSAISELFASMDTTKCFSAGGDIEIPFSTNKQWSVEIDENDNWLSCAVAEGEPTREGKLIVNVAVNDGKRREGEVTLKAGNLSETFIFVQHPAPPVVSGDFSDWECYLSTPNPNKEDPLFCLVDYRYFKVNIPDPDNYYWAVVNEFSKTDLFCYASAVQGLDGEEVQVGTLRMGPGDADITGNLVFFAVDKRTDEPIFEDAVKVELTLVSSGRLADASKDEYVKIGDIEICDRNVGENVPTPQEAPFALNYWSDYPDVNPEWAGDEISWFDAVDQFEGNADGWRLPSYQEIKSIQGRLIFSKDRYFVASDNEDGKVGSWLPLANGEAGGSYWSSEQSVGTSQYAIYLGFSKGGSAIINGMKSWKQSIRCVRTIE